MPDLTGQNIGRYHILEQLGEGGMATVYKAFDTHLERDVAIKIIRRGAFPPDTLDRILSRFKREGKALARLSHPNIIKVFDYGEYEGAPYLVMEYVPAGTLKLKLGNPIPWQEAVRLILPVAQALDYAHGEGIIHRDVKPANILITKTGQPMLSDFGIAKLLEGEEGQTLTGTGVGVGTPEYMAPEQGLGAKDIDGRADQYGLGVVLYELITGRKPYTADTPMAVVLKHHNDPLPRPSQFVPGLPQAVERVLFKALAKKPEDRYPDMAAFAAALEKLLTNTVSGTISVSTTRPSSPVVSAPESSQVTHDDLEERSASPSKRSIPIWGWIVGLVVLAAIIFVAISSSGNTPSTQLETETTSPSVATTPPLQAGDTRIREADDMVEVFIPGGTFQMGSTSGESNEQPVHSVSLSPYWIDQTEVTNDQYGLCVQAGACDPPNESDSSTRSSYYGNSQYANFPVIYMEWYDAQSYCQWVGGRLPTEAEWEFAARGTDGRMYPWGNQLPDGNLANYCDSNCELDWRDTSTDDGYADTAPVGNYPAGASLFGVQDLAGNVWQWVADWYGEYPEASQTNPQGPSTGEYHVLRGSSWYFNINDISATYRAFGLPEGWTNGYGFRCAGDTSPTSSPSTVLQGNNPGDTRTRSSDGMLEVYIPGGTFQMGSADGFEDELPMHSVTLSPFWIDQTEVTNAQYAECVIAGACDLPADTEILARSAYYDDPQYANFPVVNVNWFDARDYCRWAGGRLPTEAEWEFAARGTDGRIYPWGNEYPDGTLANYCDLNCMNDSRDSNADDGYPYNAPVGSYPSGASQFGVLDMAGNVWEWVYDWSGGYSDSSATNPQGPSSGEERVIRGGSWFEDNFNIRSSNRFEYGPEAVGTIGIRCAMDVQP